MNAFKPRMWYLIPIAFIQQMLYYLILYLVRILIFIFSGQGEC